MVAYYWESQHDQQPDQDHVPDCVQRPEYRYENEPGLLEYGAIKYQDHEPEILKGTKDPLDNPSTSKKPIQTISIDKLIHNPTSTQHQYHNLQLRT